jgi:hypothetical protein
MPRAVDTWKRVLELRGDDPEALARLANLHERCPQWAELCDVLERHFDIATETRSASPCCSAARASSSQLERRLRARGLPARPRHRLRQRRTRSTRSPRSGVAADDPHELVSVLHQTVDRRGAASLTPEQPSRSSASSGRPTSRRLAAAVRGHRRLAQAARGRPARLRGDGRLETLLRAEERWEEVIEVKMGRAEAPDPGEQIREYLEVAALWEQQVGDPDKGTPAYEKILEIDRRTTRRSSPSRELHAAAGAVSR